MTNVNTDVAKLCFVADTGPNVKQISSESRLFFRANSDILVSTCFLLMIFEQTRSYLRLSDHCAYRVDTRYFQAKCSKTLMQKELIVLPRIV